jgi:hypothetical protein
MAHTLTTQVILDGRKQTIIKVNIKGDSGDAAELSGAIIFDASAYSTGSVDNKIMEVEYCLNGFSAELFFYGTPSVKAVSIPKDHPNYTKYWDFGGVVNNATTGRNGDITITTTGLASTAYDGHIIFRVMERSVPDVGKF